MEPLDTADEPIHTSSQPPRGNRLLALGLAAFVAFMVTIVILANSGQGRRVFAYFEWIPHYDKVGHFVLMGILSFLAIVAVAPRLRWQPFVSSGIVMSTVAIIVTLEELSQSQFASRTYSKIDLIFSLAGIVCLGLVGHLTAFRSRQQRET